MTINSQKRLKAAPAPMRSWLAAFLVLCAAGAALLAYAAHTTEGFDAILNLLAT
jgi:hypothetical protein